MKRKAPPRVLPIVTKERRYEALMNKPGVLKVTQLANGKNREIVIYKQTFNPRLEKDVQVRFISALELDDEILFVEVEDGRVFLVNLGDEKVVQQN